MTVPAEIRDVYMVMVNPAGHVFVKEVDFFRHQGGFVQPWGLRWVPVVAVGLDGARRRACEVLAGALPYERQAW